MAPTPRSTSLSDSGSAAPPTGTSTAATQASITGTAYLDALAQFIRRHEAALASYNAPRSTASPAPSWTTVLTLGIVPTADPQRANGGSSNGDAKRAPRPGPPRKEPLVLRFDPHHLYYLLLKFDEIGLPSSGDLDVRVEGGTTRPMMVDYSAMSSAAAATTGGNGDGASLFGSMFARSRADDTRSIQSGMSSFSFGSGWWGLGSKPAEQVDEAAAVRYIYSSCTKLPALRLAPYQLASPSVASTGKGSAARDAALARIVEGFEDCPPPATCVPLLAFKNLSSLVLEDLDPRGFLGWDILSIQLRSLSVHRGGLEDIGELICDAPCEDLARREQEERRNKPVGTERKRRMHGASESSLAGPNEEDGEADPSSRPATPASAAYPTPPRLAWSSLRHLSLSDNSLTFIPSPPLSFLPTLTSLDLSSNLLITIPPGLAHLTSLRSLNLSDNMIDSLHGIAKALGAVEVLNLSQNRIENLSGLDRLPALERLDIRSNAVYDVLEVSRLARLPHLREVWLAGNPLTATRMEGGDDKWRVKCFGYFAEEQALGHRDLDAGEVRIDGRIVTSSERRALEAEYLSRQGRPLGLGRRKASVDALRADRPAEVRSGPQAKVVGRRVVTAPHRHSPAASTPPPPLPTGAAAPSPPGEAEAPAAAAASSTDERAKKTTPVKPRRRKPQRIVDLDSADPAPQLPPDNDDNGKVSSDTLTSVDGAGRMTSSLGRAPGKPPPARNRRERVSASLYDVPDSSSSETGSGEAFRRKIEALRSEVGETWLSVLAEREAREERDRQQRERRETAEPAPQSKDPAGSKRIEEVPEVKPDPVERADTDGDKPPAAVVESALPPPEGVTTTDPHEAMPRDREQVQGGEAAAPAPATAVARPEVETEAAAGQEEAAADDAAAEGSAAVPTTVKSVRKKRGKGKKRGGR
ncbi:hypothetical protein JCM8202_005945 [Rhodotorula sphaerocarpa]